MGEPGPVIRVKNASHPQTFGGLDKHQGGFDIDDLPDWCLGDVKRKPTIFRNTQVIAVAFFIVFASVD